jgi:hypothetical protein
VRSIEFSQVNVDAKRELFAALFVSLQESWDDFFEYQAWVRKSSRGTTPGTTCRQRSIPSGHGVGRSMPGNILTQILTKRVKRSMPEPGRNCCPTRIHENTTLSLLVTALMYIIT